MKNALWKTSFNAIQIEIKKENLKNLAPFDIPEPTVEDISLIIKSLHPRKAAGWDCISLKVIKFASNVIDSHL